MAKRRNTSKSGHIDKYASAAEVAQLERKQLDQRAAKVEMEKQKKEYTNYCKKCNLVKWECDTISRDHDFQPLSKQEMIEREESLEAAVGKEMFAIAFYNPRHLQSLIS